MFIDSLTIAGIAVAVAVAGFLYRIRCPRVGGCQ
jgi:hypothetical protein